MQGNVNTSKLHRLTLEFAKIDHSRQDVSADLTFSYPTAAAHYGSLGDRSISLISHESPVPSM